MKATTKDLRFHSSDMVRDVDEYVEGKKRTILNLA